MSPSKKEPLKQDFEVDTSSPSPDSSPSLLDEPSSTDQQVKAKLIELALKDTSKSSSVPDELSAKSFMNSFLTLEKYLTPIFLTLLSFFVRMYKIGINNHVVWDEAHFGKFGSYYLRHSFYHDVHPPLGKMLVGLSGYIAGYNGSWDFPSGEEYPDYIDYVKMRLFNASFGALIVPVAYFTAKEIGFNRKACLLYGLMVCLETSYTTLARFILLDSMLLFFTATTFYAMNRFHNKNRFEALAFSRKWWKWLLLTGISIGCVCSVKLVGLFVTAVVGIYTIFDLWIKFGRLRTSMSVSRYTAHWMARILALIVIPLCVFMTCFKVHFDLLSGTGPGDATMSSLFQANLLGSSLTTGPRDVMTINSTVTIKSQGLGGGLLHSHIQSYPEGSNQQQVTTYTHKDANNDWRFELVRSDPRMEFREPYFVVDGMHVRLIHEGTGRNLHSHPVPAPISANIAYEVAGYGDLDIGDDKDNWVVEIAYQYGTEDKLRLHPLTTSFRLRHEILGCYLASMDIPLPQWGFRQGEVTCLRDPFQRDKRTWWNIEDHTNPTLPTPPEGFKLPRTNFFKDFIQLNIAMLATNNGLIPDSEKFDQLASSFWQWPSLNVGIRLCSWADDSIKYFLIGSPATTWTSSIALIVFIAMIVAYVLRWQRQYDDFPEEKTTTTTVDSNLLIQRTVNDEWNLFVMGGFFPFLGWFFHYLPFGIMGRVTYVHHYMPALYFAMLVMCYVVHWVDARVSRRWFTVSLYISLYALIIGVYIRLSPVSFGMDGPSADWKYLNVLKTWSIG
ncbi:hypothetical protein FOA43_002959 [Brettanomyces nanus]|uniref:Dolichyl-phosphate-mannose--protein mannosyltransferase n=1 Tax=Eeniella nana TaxID=13502 RepID=A0A875S6I1_EENNA|nr:uncharacterized protein FOA43_002959 [Brettanomyces nanus]QPG75602.1 hypothetical protein FOA43_002959 [Brettanomyces nanus]